MSVVRTLARWALGAMVTAESVAAYARHDRRTRLFYEAGKRAQALGRPLEAARLYEPACCANVATRSSACAISRGQS